MLVRRKVGSKGDMPLGVSGVSRDVSSEALVQMVEDFDVDWGPGEQLVPLADMIVTGADLPRSAILLPSETEPDLSKCEGARNEQWAKPRYGLWTSPVTKNGSAWTEWCEAENHMPVAEGKGTLWEVETPKDAVILKVSKKEEAALVHELFNEPPTDTLSSMYALVDYEGLAASGVDAIWLTAEAARQTSSSLFTTEPSPFNLWDCETILWLKPPTEAKFSALQEVSFESFSDL